MFSHGLLEAISGDFPNAQIVVVVTYENGAAHLHILGTHSPQENVNILLSLLEVPPVEEFSTDYIIDTTKVD